MPRPRILTASTNLALRELAATELADTSLDKTWIVARHRDAANRLLYYLLDRASADLVEDGSQTATALGVERGTLLQCAQHIATSQLTLSGFVPATQLGIEAAVLRGLSEAHSDLIHLAAIGKAHGMASRLAATLSETKHQDVDRRRLAHVAPVGSDIDKISRAYDEALREAHIADSADVLDRAITVLGQGEPTIDRLVLFDHPVTSTLEVKFLHRLATVGVDCRAIALDRDEATLQRLRRAWGDADEIAEPTTGQEKATSDKGLDRLRSRLFAGGERAQTKAEVDDSFEIVAAEGEDREALELVRRIQLQAEAGQSYDRFGVVVRTPDIYQPVLEEAFSRADIPAHFSRGVLRPDPTGRAFLALLKCRHEEYSANRFAEYLSLGQVPSFVPQDKDVWVIGGDQAVPQVNVDDSLDLDSAQLSLGLTAPKTESNGAPTAVSKVGEEPPTRPVFPRRWERLLVEASVIGGLDRWRERLAGLERELQLQLSHASIEDGPRAAALQSTLEQVRDLQTFALPLIQRLSTLPSRADIGDWIPLLEDLARTALRHPQRVLSLLADLRPMAGVGEMSLAEIHQLLQQHLNDLRIKPPGSPYGKVFVGTPEEFRGLCFDTVLVCGLAEGIFPRKVREDPLLLDEARRNVDANLATNAERIASERLRLQTAVAAAKSRLVISYPTWDGLTGRARVPSFYAFDAVSAAYDRVDLLTDLSIAGEAGVDPSVAIDAAEYDITRTTPLLSDSSSQMGQLNYLLSTNPNLERSLRTRGRRWLNFLSNADGLVDPDDESLARLAAYRLRSRRYSPTALQHFAICPYRFYLQGVLRLRKREETRDLEQMDPLTRGSFYHSVQFRFLRDLTAEAGLEFSTERADELLQALDNAIKAVAEEYTQELRPALPAVFNGEIEGIRTDLRGWLRQLLSDSDYVPNNVELSFGLPIDGEHDPASRDQPVEILDRLLAKGSIDMVEKAQAGGYRVTDHKTGKPIDTRSLTVGGGEALQPLIYAFAAEQLLGEKVTEGRLWYSTRRGRYSSLTVPTGEYQRQSLATVLDTVDQAIETGFLPAAPRSGACTYCDYRSVCGPHEELRIAIKARTAATQKRLADLTHMRNME